MRTYLVALHLPAAWPAALTLAGERARSALEDLTQEGVTVRWIRSVYLAEDDSCLLVFEGASPEAIGEASRRAALEYERIVEAGEPAR